MDVLDVLLEATRRIDVSVKGLAGTKDAGGDFGRGAGGDISKRIDIVAENAVLEYLKEIEFPCTVLGEECGRIDITNESKGSIVMDAIDGTTNAVRGFPYYCSSLAFVEGNTLSSVTAGVIKNLSNGQTYWATRGSGAFMDNNPIRASMGEPGYTIVGVNISGATPDTISRIQTLASESHVRHMGANALEMALLAQGLMDAYVDVRNKIRIQDIAVGYLLVRESGGLVLDENMDILDMDISYGRSVSYLAAANKDVANWVAEKIGYGALGGI